MYISLGKRYSASLEKMDIISVIHKKNQDEHLVEMHHLELEERKLQLEERRLAMEEKKIVESTPFIAADANSAFQSI